MANLFAYLQYLLPRYLLTRIVYSLSRVRRPAVKDALIRGFVRLYDVDISDIARSAPDGFNSFNDFFTRELRDDARPLDTAAVVAPCDGKVSAVGTIRNGELLQAKGQPYSVEDLLAVDTDDAGRLHDGRFLTIYLAPYNYHRVHLPMGGRLESLHYIPGDLFSVNGATAAVIPRLFARNERLVAKLVAPEGTFFVVMVGALNVGSITTPWSGELRPRRDGSVQAVPLDSAVGRDLARGDLLGWFNMGSTVILLGPPDLFDWDSTIAPGRVVRMGNGIGIVGDAAD